MKTRLKNVRTKQIDEVTQMDKMRISVIMPVRDASQYLHATLEKLTKLKFPSWELIIVDDGSKDATNEILQKWIANSKLNCTVIRNRVPMGVAAARNRAVEQVKGAYVWFADSDDSWSDDILTHLWSGVINQNVDMVICDAEKLIEETGHKSIICDAPQRTTFKGTDALRRILQGHIQGHLWNKLIRSELLREYPFPLLRSHSDLGGILKYASESRVVSTVPGAKYRYHVHHGSILQSADYKWETLLECTKIAQELAKENPSQINLASEIETFKFANVLVPAANATAKHTTSHLKEIPYRDDVTLKCILGLHRRGRHSLAIKIGLIRWIPQSYSFLYKRYYAAKWGNARLQDN